MKMDIDKLNLEIAKSCMIYKEVAGKAGISEITLRKIRAGKRNAKASTIGKIAKALNIPVTSLIEENE